MQILHKEKLQNEGFLTFNIKDIDETLYTELYDNFNKDISFNKIKRLRYDSGFSIDNIDCSVDDYFNNLKNKFILHKDSSINYYSVSNKDIRVSLNIRGEYESLCKWKHELDNINSNTKSQSWFFTSPYTDFKVNKTVQNVYKKILSELYFDYLNNDYYSEPNLGFDLSLYTAGDFIETHNDGIDPNRLCVILIYLNDDYQEGFGGEIVVENNTIIPPIFGQVCILDFTHNNPTHSVNMVIDTNFKRFAYIRFFYKDIIK